MELKSCFGREQKYFSALRVVFLERFDNFLNNLAFILQCTCTSQVILTSCLKSASVGSGRTITMKSYFQGEMN